MDKQVSHHGDCNQEYLQVTEECDLIMKGGITSGVTYPPALLELAKKFRFNSIGGTSAGAIAAVVAAAAEYGRENCGFDKMTKKSDWLSAGTNLRDLFQPARGTAALFHVMLDMITFSTKPKPKLNNVKLTSVVNTFRTVGRLIPSLLHRAWVSALAGALLAMHLLVLLAGLAMGKPLSWWDFFLLNPVGALLGDLSSSWQDFFPILKWIHRGALDGVGLIPTFIVILLGALIGSAARLVVNLIAGMKNNLYGLCTGHKDATGGAPAFTDWMSTAFDDIAGLSSSAAPITFGHLDGKVNSNGEKAPITLELVTTNLSHRQAYMLPFQEGEKDLFVFKEEEMKRLFPAYVVEHLVKHAGQSTRFTLNDCPGYHLLPERKDFPLVVAIRLSLSVPPLVSAVPLYTVQQLAIEEAIKKGEVLSVQPEHLQKNWFSDGGISSNFPIHLFDNLLSKRPTFAINLTSLPAGALIPVGPTMPAGDIVRQKVSPDNFSYVQQEQPSNIPSPPPQPGNNPNDDVFLPAAYQEMYPQWRSVESLGGFVQGIFDTAREHTDNAQSLLPSYRERIVHIRFADNEGGMNLAMDNKTIDRIKDKGLRAGQKLVKFPYQHHQWVRFKVVMGQLEKRLRKMNENYGKRNNEPAASTREAVYTTLLRNVGLAIPGRSEGETFPFPEDTTWCDEAVRRAEQLLALVSSWEEDDKAQKEDSSFFLDKSPTPQPDLRVAPRV
jgi:predicted acylesterase/phospholipase RssA